MQTQPYEVRDGSRLITFDGVLLGAVSSKRPSSPRWSEYHLYRTEGGVYVLEKVGRSTVVHMPNCPEIIGDLKRFQEVYPGKDPTEDGWFCETCLLSGYDITALLVESDRYWATISEEPQQIIEALYRRKDGARSLQRLSLELLEQVAQVDPNVADAYRVEHIS
jgi:hypothetical protein